MKKRTNVWRYLALGYLLVIVIGSLLLVMPFAARGGSTSYIDALFTSASAACVTGLVPFETNVHWTGFGQAVILLLIQLGGLGFMTFVSLIFLAIKRLGQYERRAVLQSVGGGELVSVRRLVRRILFGTLLFEFIGAGLLCIRFIPDFGVGRGMWYALFHAVSAFCNAGFDLMGGTSVGTGSLSHYGSDPLVSLTVCGLIILGGLGFCVWEDVLDAKLRPRKFHFYTRVILTVNAVLIAGGTLLFLWFEWGNPAYAGMGFGERLLRALFCSVTPRTAGFYTTDPATMSNSGYLLTLVLMFIGGCSGSTAGGIKVGTITVIVMGMISVFRNTRDINIGKRRIDLRLLGQALAIFAAYLFLVVAATLVICRLEPDLNVIVYNGQMRVGTFEQALFETISALGTVGLTIGFTPTLCWASKLILILLMYAGRVGVLTLALALGRKRDTAEVRRPVETFYIG